eukprot:2900713-Alexandrium_andersonii.AAC.1
MCIRDSLPIFPQRQAQKRCFLPRGSRALSRSPPLKPSSWKYTPETIRVPSAAPPRCCHRLKHAEGAPSHS